VSRKQDKEETEAAGDRERQRERDGGRERVKLMTARGGLISQSAAVLDSVLLVIAVLLGPLCLGLIISCE